MLGYTYKVVILGNIFYPMAYADFQCEFSTLHPDSKAILGHCLGMFATHQ